MLVQYVSVNSANKDINSRACSLNAQEDICQMAYAQSDIAGEHTLPIYLQYSQSRVFRCFIQHCVGRTLGPFYIITVYRLHCGLCNGLSVPTQQVWLNLERDVTDNDLVNVELYSVVST